MCQNGKVKAQKKENEFRIKERHKQNDLKDIG